MATDFVNPPKFSVILPAHKHTSYLEDAIKSVLAQEFKDFELIIIANGPHSAFAKKLKSIYTDPRIAIIETPIPSLVFALNLGINSSRAELIVRMDSDDICKNNRLSVLWEIFQEKPNIDIVGSAYETIDHSGLTLKKTSIAAKNSTQIRKTLPFRCCIPHPTVAFKKSTILKHGGYSFGAFSEDYDLWLRMSRSTETNFLIVSDILLQYRIHNGQATNRLNNWLIFSYDFALKTRELLITKRLIYLAGIAFSLIDFIYKNYLFKYTKD